MSKFLFLTVTAGGEILLNTSHIISVVDNYAHEPRGTHITYQVGAKVREISVDANMSEMEVILSGIS